MTSTSMLGHSVRDRARSGSLGDQAYQQIKDRILSGAMPPASVIDARALGRKLKLGQTPIRLALRWLALENLVVILPRRGTIVADVNASDLQKVYEIRIKLVPHAFELAAERITPGQLAALEQVWNETAAQLSSGAPAELLRLDRRFQALVIEASRNEFLIEILERLHTQAMRFWRIERVSDADLRGEMRQQKAILASLTARDGHAASRAIHDTIAEFHRSQLRAI